LLQAAESHPMTNATTVTEGALTIMLTNKIKTVIVLAQVLLAGVAGTLTSLPGLAAGDDIARSAKAKEGPPAARQTTAAPKIQFPDLTKMDRTIRNEPQYKSQPFYALLTIGPQAKKRVWLVVDGATLYVDRNGNGDLTEANERVERPKRIEVAPGMYWWMNSFDIGDLDGLRLRLDFWVRNKDFVPQTDFDKQIQKDHEENGWEFATLFRVKPDGSNIPAQIPIAFCRQPKDCQVCHLGGPLTFTLRSNDPLVCDSGQNMLQVMIGTPGLPARKWSNPVFAPLGTNEVPADVHPVARFQFPHKDPKQRPIELEVVLNQRC
jgi:hypothetical protein